MGAHYCAARSALGMERAKALIAIGAAEKAKVSPADAFEITLSVVEEDVHRRGMRTEWLLGGCAQNALVSTIVLALL